MVAERGALDEIAVVAFHSFHASSGCCVQAFVFVGRAVAPHSFCCSLAW